MTQNNAEVSIEADEHGQQIAKATLGGVTAIVHKSLSDPGRMVVQVDSEPGVEVNIYLNDGALFLGDPG